MPIKVTFEIRISALWEITFDEMYETMYSPLLSNFHSVFVFVPQNMTWRQQNFANGQHDLVWHQYLRRQADLPAQHGIPYGKRQRSSPANSDDSGISKIDFTSPPVTLTWLDLKAEAPPKDKGIKRTLTKAFCPWKEVGQPKMLLKGGQS